MEQFNYDNIDITNDFMFVNNPVPVSLLSGNRKPQICF